MASADPSGDNCACVQNFDSTISTVLDYTTRKYHKKILLERIEEVDNSIANSQTAINSLQAMISKWKGYITLLEKRKINIQEMIKKEEPELLQHQKDSKNKISIFRKKIACKSRLSQGQLPPKKRNSKSKAVPEVILLSEDEIEEDNINGVTFISSKTQN